MSKLMYDLIPGTQLLIWKMPFSSFLSTGPTRDSLVSVGKASNTTSLSYIHAYQFFRLKS